MLIILVSQARPGRGHASRRWLTSSLKALPLPEDEGTKCSRSVRRAVIEERPAVASGVRKRRPPKFARQSRKSRPQSTRGCLAPFRPRASFRFPPDSSSTRRTHAVESVCHHEICATFKASSDCREERLFSSLFRNFDFRVRRASFFLMKSKSFSKPAPVRDSLPCIDPESHVGWS